MTCDMKHVLKDLEDEGLVQSLKRCFLEKNRLHQVCLLLSKIFSVGFRYNDIPKSYLF